MAGAGTLLIVVGAFSLLYIGANRRRLRAETRRARTLPLLGELPLGIYAGAQVLGCLVCVGLGIWLIAAG